MGRPRGGDKATLPDGLFGILAGSAYRSGPFSCKTSAAFCPVPGISDFMELNLRLVHAARACRRSGQGGDLEPWSHSGGIGWGWEMME